MFDLLKILILELNAGFNSSGIFLSAKSKRFSSYSKTAAVELSGSFDSNSFKPYHSTGLKIRIIEYSGIEMPEIIFRIDLDGSYFE